MHLVSEQVLATHRRTCECGAATPFTLFTSSASASFKMASPASLSRPEEFVCLIRFSYFNLFDYFVVLKEILLVVDSMAEHVISVWNSSNGQFLTKLPVIFSYFLNI